MKKAATVFIPIIVMFFVAATANAQDFDFNRAYQDYLYAQNVYNQDHASYQDARDFYLTNQTLTLKEDARKKTLQMLKDRDKLESVYLTALRMKIVETKGLSSDQKGGIFGKIDPEVKWYQDHVSSYQDGDQTDTLFSKSAESEDRYKSSTLPIIYESLFNISLGTEIGMRQDQEEIYASLKNIIDAGVGAGKLDINPFNRWFSDIDTVISTLKENESTSNEQIQKIYGQYFSLQGSYNTAVNTLSSSLTSLKQLNSFLTEVLTSIKNQQQ